MREYDLYEGDVDVELANGLKDKVRRIWQRNFDAADKWLDMYFERVYRDEDLLWYPAADDDDYPAASLLLQPYHMQWEGRDINIGYISGAVTDRHYRGRGYMSALMRTAIQESRRRGDLLLTLIPAQRWLYFFYGTLGFSTVFYIDEARYSSKHRFEPAGGYKPTDNVDAAKLYAAVDAMLRQRGNVVLHSRADFDNILDDIRLDGGHAVTIVDDEGEVAAFALVAKDDDGHVTVRECLSSNNEAREAVLARVRQLYPHASITLVLPAGELEVPIHSRAMARIVNALELLKVYAANNPRVSCAIRLHDEIVKENNHIFVIDRGQALVNDGFGGKLDLDVSQETLLAILCSDPRTGSIFNLPTSRPSISMMMD